MKKLATILFASAMLVACTPSKSIFELSPSQSMSITGKGPGQDAAFNPYGDNKSVAVVRNIGEHGFMIRVQEQGTIIRRIPISPKEKKEVVLEEGYELYLDSELASKARLIFKKFN
jgi:hypothetical protein